MTPKDILVALAEGKKLRNKFWTPDEFVTFEDTGRLIDEDGETYPLAELLESNRNIEVYEPKLTDEDLIAEWERLAYVVPFSEQRFTFLGCARQLRERKL